MTIRRIFAALCACLSLMAPAAFAAVIDFENVGAVDCDTATISSDGYTFGGTGERCVYGPGDAGIENANNGTYFMIDGGQLASLTNIAGQPFSVISLDLGISFFNDMSPNLLTVTGFFADGGAISETLIMTNDFQTFALTGFENLFALTFNGLQIPNSGDGQIGYIAIDNLILREEVEGPPNGVVPVPASLPLFALGMGVMAAMRRRYQ